MNNTDFEKQNEKEEEEEDHWTFRSQIKGQNKAVFNFLPDLKETTTKKISATLS